jgi:hypothetical protein
MTKMQMFIPITKVDVARRLVYGIAATETPDKSGEVFDYDSSKPNFEKWSSEFEKQTDGKSKGNMRAMHSAIAAGRFEELVLNDDDKQVEVCGKVVDDNEWNKVVEGVYTGFSIGGSYAKRWKDGEHMRYTAVPSEISLVDNPCNGDALFTMVKADGSQESRHFANKEIQMITNDMVAAKAKELAKAAGDENKWPSLVDEARVELEKAAPVELTDEQKAEAAKAEADALAVKKVAEVPAPNAPAPDLEQVWKAKDGTTFGKKAEAIAHNEALTKAEAAANDPAAKLAAGLADLTKTVDDLGKREFSEKEREKAADTGAAMEDGSFPIKTKADLRNAIKAYGRAKDKAATKKHIIERAKALGAESELPEDWVKKMAGHVDKCYAYTKGEDGRMRLKYVKGIPSDGAAGGDGNGGANAANDGTTGVTSDDGKGEVKKFAGGVFLTKATDAPTLKKGLYFVAILARIIEDLQSLQCSTEWEAASEGDNSPVPEKLKEDMAELCATLMMLAEEETHELLGDEGGQSSFPVLAASDSPRGFNALVKLVPSVGKLVKREQAEMDKVQAIHDHSCDMGAMCKAAEEDDDADEDEKDAKKAAGGELTKALAVEKERTATLEKAIASALPVIDELKKRVQQLEDQPKPRPVEVVSIASKEQDNAVADLQKLAKDDPDRIAQAIIQLAQKQPMNLYGR